MVAAIRNGDGIDAVEAADKSMSAKRTLESNTNSASRGMTFFFAAIIKVQQFFVKKGSCQDFLTKLRN